jgi:hypothetical protein
MNLPSLLVLESKFASGAVVQNDSPEIPKGPGKAGLLQYRLYFLEGLDSLISYSHEFEAADDDRAIRISEAWREGRGAELWCGSRKVKSWDHTHDR